MTLIFKKTLRSGKLASACDYTRAPTCTACTAENKSIPDLRTIAIISRCTVFSASFTYFQPGASVKAHPRSFRCKHRLSTFIIIAYRTYRYFFSFRQFRVRKINEHEVHDALYRQRIEAGCIITKTQNEYELRKLVYVKWRSSQFGLR